MTGNTCLSICEYNDEETKVCQFRQVQFNDGECVFFKKPTQDRSFFPCRVLKMGICDADNCAFNASNSCMHSLTPRVVGGKCFYFKPGKYPWIFQERE